MAIFIIETEKTPELESYLDKIKSRFGEANMVRNPFKSTISQKDNLVIIEMQPLYPNPAWLGLICLVPLLIFLGLSWWLLGPLAIMATGLSHSAWFFYKMFVKGAKKHGYTGTVKRLSLEEGVKRLM